MKFSRILLAAAALICAGASTRAGTVLYNSQASFNAAVTSTTLQDFQSLSNMSIGGSPVSLGSGLSVQTYGTLSGAAIGTGNFGSRCLFFSTSNSAGGVQFSFSPGVTAFGMDVRDLGTFGTTTLSFGLENGDSGSFVTNFIGSSGNLMFVGLTSTSAFTWIKISNSAIGDYVEFDNIRYGTAAVPEPSSIALIGSALGAAGLLAVRRRKAA